MAFAASHYTDPLAKLIIYPYFFGGTFVVISLGLAIVNLFTKYINSILIGVLWWSSGTRGQVWIGILYLVIGLMRITQKRNTGNEYQEAVTETEKETIQRKVETFQGVKKKKYLLK